VAVPAVAVQIQLLLLLLLVMLLLVGHWQRCHLLRHACCRQLHDCLLDDGCCRWKCWRLHPRQLLLSRLPASAAAVAVLLPPRG
jgi:hypothetical protein